MSYHIQFFDIIGLSSKGFRGKYFFDDWLEFREILSRQSQTEMYETFCLKSQIFLNVAILYPLIIQICIPDS